MPEEDEDGFGESSVAPLAYNFSKWGLGNGKVNITEPSTEQVAAFYAATARLNDRIAEFQRETIDEKIPDDETPDQRDLRVETTIVEGQRRSLEFENEKAENYAAVCSNTPDAETILKLPHRVRRTFYGYLLGRLNPEA